MRGLRTGVAIAVTALLMGGAGAYAQSQITSAQIKNNTITSADIKNKSITSSDLSASTVRSLAGKTGPAGPAGPAGPPGATVQGSQTAGPQGPAGQPVLTARTAPTAPELWRGQQTTSRPRRTPWRRHGSIGVARSLPRRRAGHHRRLHPRHRRSSAEVYARSWTTFGRSRFIVGRAQPVAPTGSRLRVENELDVFVDCVPTEAANASNHAPSARRRSSAGASRDRR